MQTKHKMFSLDYCHWIGPWSRGKKSLHWRDPTASGCTLHTDYGVGRIAPRRQRSTPTSPGSWTHTYSNNISQGLTWSACSQDLNPIEHVWDQLGRAAQARLNVNSTCADLRRFLVEEWDRLTQNNVQLLVHSMHRRCAACIAARGGPIHYWCNESIKWLWSPLRVFHPECFKNEKVPLLGPYPPCTYPSPGTLIIA